MRECMHTAVMLAAAACGKKELPNTLRMHACTHPQATHWDATESTCVLSLCRACGLFSVSMCVGLLLCLFVGMPADVSNSACAAASSLEACVSLPFASAAELLSLR